MLLLIKEFLIKVPINEGIIFLLKKIKYQTAFLQIAEVALFAIYQLISQQLIINLLKGKLYQIWRFKLHFNGWFIYNVLFCRDRSRINISGRFIRRIVPWTFLHEFVIGDFACKLLKIIVNLLFQILRQTAFVLSWVFTSINRKLKLNWLVVCFLEGFDAELMVDNWFVFEMTPFLEPSTN